MDFRLRRPTSSMNFRINARIGCAGSRYQKSVKSRKEPPMGTSKIPTLEQYWKRLADELPQFSPEEQRTAVTLYRELAKG